MAGDDDADARGAGFDWRAAYARIASMQTDSLQAPDVVEAVLRRRADAFGKLRDEADDDVVDLLVFALGGSRFGLTLPQLEAVMPASGCVPVPCTPPTIHGVVNYRGEAAAVLDLRPYFGLPETDDAPSGVVVMVAAESRRYGLLGDELIGMQRVEARRIVPAPALLSDERDSPLAGVTQDMVVLLNAEHLAHDPRLIVNEAD